MIKAQQSWVKHKDTPKYHEGDLVWLEGHHLRTNQPTAKLAPKRHGPFPIIQVMSPVNYQLKLPTQWSIHDVFHIDLLTPYRETDLHISNYLRPAPDLIDNEEEYKVKKILDSRQFSRRHKKQYLIKWKGYPDSDNEWVDKRDVHVPDTIREFENSNHAASSHIREGKIGEYPIIPTQPNHLAHSTMTNDVDNYYLGSPERIFGAELDTQLISPVEARELCAKKYIRPHIKDKNELIVPLTKEELVRVQEVFPDLEMTPVPAHALSPLLQSMSDPDGMGATLTHQAEVQELDRELWEAEGVLQVPPRVEGIASSDALEDQPAVEGRAVHQSRIQEKHRQSSLGSTAPADTSEEGGPWSHTTSLMDWYPAEHPFIWNTCDTDNPNETPYSLTTDRYPLYKKSYMLALMSRHTPVGFKANCRKHFIDFPIHQPSKTTTQQAHYTQAIMAPNPLVVALCKDTDKVYSKPLYASPVYKFNGKPVYSTDELDYLKADAQGCNMTNQLINRIGDLSLMAKVHQFRVIMAELERMEQVLAENEEACGQLATAKLGTIR